MNAPHATPTSLAIEPWGFSAELERERLGKRWRLRQAYDADDLEIPGMLRLTVVTPLGTGPQASGIVMISMDGARDRRLLAMHLREARVAASYFRKTNRPPEYVRA